MTGVAVEKLAHNRGAVPWTGGKQSRTGGQNDTAR